MNTMAMLECRDTCAGNTDNGHKPGNQMDKTIVAEPFSPGEIIQRELDAREWTQDDLAEAMGCTRENVNGLLQARGAINTEIAQELATAFGTSAELWLNLQSSYELAQDATEVRDSERRAS